MTKNQLQLVLDRAATAVAREARGEFTEATGQTEWNLAHRLAMKVHRHLRQLDCDTDVRKPDFGGKRPDIIYHLRNTHRRNFLVIETKFNGSPAALLSDLRKIRNNWFRPPLLYRFGAVVNLRDDGTAAVRLLTRPQVVIRKRAQRVKKKQAS